MSTIQHPGMPEEGPAHDTEDGDRPAAIAPPPGLAAGAPVLQDLTEEECWQLLGGLPVGRVAVNVDFYPVVLPVNYAIVDGAVVFCSGLGGKLNRIHGAKVSFEVDQIDPVHHTGWSVLVKGRAQGLNVGADRGLAERAQAAGATPWAPGERRYLVRIESHQVTGRRITKWQEGMAEGG